MGGGEGGDGDGQRVRNGEREALLMRAQTQQTSAATAFCVRSGLVQRVW